MIHKRLRNIVYTDVITAHHWARCAPCVDESSNLFTPSHWLKGLVRVLSPHPIHACARGCLSVLFLLSFYFFLKSFFHLFLIPAMVPDENSMKDPLCNSAIGSMVSLDYVTPDTRSAFGLWWLCSQRSSIATMWRTNWKVITTRQIK